MPCEPVCDVADDPCVEPCWPELVRVVVVVVLEDVVDEVCPELDEVLGLVCATIHVARKSSTESNGFSSNPPGDWSLISTCSMLPLV